MSVAQRAWLLAVVLAVLAGWPAAAQAVAAAPASLVDDMVTYYVLRESDLDRPKPLEVLADRVLGDAARADEIFKLNAGRAQPDGGSLTDPARIKVGWVLVLPWDAAGEGVARGPLPQSGASAPPPPPSTAPAVEPVTGGCAATQPTPATTNRWAQLRMAPHHAWTRTRGEGQIVAVVDSGVDASLPHLAGRVSAGANIVIGDGRGDTDCLGSGTAMATHIVGGSVDGGSAGMAPGATVMPVRVTTNAPVSRADDAAAGISVAVSAGATIIALGPVVDLRDIRVAEAVVQAASHNVVVLAAAPTNPVAPDQNSPVDQAERVTLRVAGVDLSGQPIAAYRTGAVDVVAPGAEVASVGIAGTGVTIGTGTHHAVGFAAGTVALVRAALPHLTAAQVVERIRLTAEPIGEAKRPSPVYGWGMVSAAAAVSTVLSAEQAGAVPTGAPEVVPTAATTMARSAAIAAVVVVALLAAILVVARVRRLARPRDAAPPPTPPDPLMPLGPPVSIGPALPPDALAPPRAVDPRLTASGLTTAELSVPQRGLPS